MECGKIFRVCIDFVLLFKVTRSKTKTNRDLLACLIPLAYFGSEV